MAIVSGAINYHLRGEAGVYEDQTMRKSVEVMANHNNIPQTAVYINLTVCEESPQGVRSMSTLFQPRLLDEDLAVSSCQPYR